ncbi:hypothetical protein B1757_13620 [Acidithiobacillus marinus]|uniref:AAA domain-containing protein n=1 Tax=Acidithiobacillus marinus TaxID=187490 RepID=A0A2I1DIE7_9PROT|nr:ParA family protein [Acidithiobacillus marinus]PKY09638.1 hypothetical protein B1757_13620 [Acidithiobacillus marinus]
MENRSIRFKRKVLAELGGFDSADDNRLRTIVNRLNLGEPVHPRANEYTGADARAIRAEPGTPNPLPNLPSPEIMACFFTKGGVGKTTICANLGLALAMAGNRVLLIDSDPQASLSMMFGVDIEAEITTLGDVVDELIQHNRWMDLSQATTHPIDGVDLDIIPSDPRLVRTEMLMIQTPYRERVIERIFEHNKTFLSGYDFILIDTGPSVTALSFALLAASDHVLAVVELAGMAIKAMNNLFNVTAELEQGTQRQVPITFVPNGLHGGKHYTAHTLEVIRSAAEGKKMVRTTNTVIPEYIGLARHANPSQQRTLMEMEPGSPAAKKIIELANEIEILSMRDKGVLNPVRGGESQ